MFALTLLIKAIREPDPYPDLFNKDLYDILSIVFVTFAHHIYIAIVPAIIIGFVFYFYILIQQEVD